MKGLVFATVLNALVSCGGPAPVPAEELARRVETSEPQWANYPEDIKAQIGATPVASWSGNLVAVQREGQLMEVTFALKGPWSSAGHPGVPILMRDPLSNNYRSDTAFCGNGQYITYEFQLAESVGEIPWIEIMYPHHKRQVMLSRDGSWEERADD